MTIELKEGDIYRWHYNDATRAEILKWRHDPYWCCSRIAIVKNGVLTDTYWGILSTESVSWNAEKAESELALTFVTNFSDLDKADPWIADSYDDADIVDLRHANSMSGNFYLRKGSKRSPEKMLQTARDVIAKAQREIKSAQYQIDRHRKIVEQIECGADLSEIHL